jgi:isoleucyl-tRNA synthetase
VTLYCADDLLQRLSRLQNELRFVLIVSTATLKPLAEGADAAATEIEGLRLSVVPSANPKCSRCWHHRADVGINAAHPEICGRCVDNIEGDGEQRLYA